MDADDAEQYYLGQRIAYWGKNKGKERRQAQNRLNQHISRWRRKHLLETREDYLIAAANVIAMGKGQKLRAGRPKDPNDLKDPKRRASQRLAKKQHKPSPESEEGNRSTAPDREFSFELLDQDPRNDASISAHSSSDELSHILPGETRQTSSQQPRLPPYDDGWLRTNTDYFDEDPLNTIYSLDADTTSAWCWAEQHQNFDGSQSLGGTMRHSHASYDANLNISGSEFLMSNVFGESQPHTPLKSTQTHREFGIWMEQLSDVDKLHLHAIAAELKRTLEKGPFIRSCQSTTTQPPSNEIESSAIEEFCHKLKEEILIMRNQKS